MSFSPVMAFQRGVRDSTLGLRRATTRRDSSFHVLGEVDIFIGQLGHSPQGFHGISPLQNLITADNRFCEVNWMSKRREKFVFECVIAVATERIDCF